MSLYSSLQDFVAAPKAANSLRLLSFNMQVGIRTGAYHHYLLKSWQHLLPSKQRQFSLNHIAELVNPFDVVALQEADGGSWRSQHLNQVQHLAEKAAFPHWYQQVNRNLGKLAQHSNGVLSRLPAQQIERHSLPGLLPGRGLMVVKYQFGRESLVVAVTHLALGKNTQFSQLDYLVEAVADAKHLVIMGDLNQEAEVLLKQSPLKRLNLHPVDSNMHTFPSWRPQRGLDHILISDNLSVNRLAVIDHPHSDHLPVAAEIFLPNKL